jgi:hypothetical protein
MTEPCIQHESCTKNITKNEANIESQGKNIDKLFELFREVKDGFNEVKLEVQQGISDIKLLVEKKENKVDSRLAGLHIKLLKILLYVAAGKGGWDTIKGIFLL